MPRIYPSCESVPVCPTAWSVESNVRISSQGMTSLTLPCDRATQQRQQITRRVAEITLQTQAQNGHPCCEPVMCATWPLSLTGPGRVAPTTWLKMVRGSKKNCGNAPQILDESGRRIVVRNWAQNLSHAQTLRTDLRLNPLSGHEIVARKRVPNPDRVFGEKVEVSVAFL